MVVFIVVTCMHRLEELFAAYVLFGTGSVALSPSASPSCSRVRFNWRFGIEFESVSTHPERFLGGKGLAVIGPMQGESLRVFRLLVLAQVYKGV